MLGRYYNYKIIGKKLGKWKCLLRNVSKIFVEELRVVLFKY